MADQSIQGGAKGASDWSEFQKRNSGHRFLTEDPIYSIPKKLISAINSWKSDFFSDSDLEFENDLSESTKDGFFLGKTLDFFPELDINDPIFDEVKEINEIDDEYREKSKSLSSKILKLTQPKRSNESIKKSLDIRFDKNRLIYKEKEKRILERKKSYIGWLYTNGYYLGCIKDLKNKIQNKVKEFGGFHKYDLDLQYQEKFSCEEYTGVFRILNNFYCSWNFNSFYTFDMPEIINSSFENNDIIEFKNEQNGVYVFLPWYCVKGDLINFSEEVRNVERNGSLRHILPFFEMEEKKGYQYYENMFVFYRYFYLAIYKRYKENLKGNLQKFDTLLNCLFFSGEDSISRIRKDFYRIYTELGIIRR